MGGPDESIAGRSSAGRRHASGPGGKVAYGTSRGRADAGGPAEGIIADIAPFRSPPTRCRRCGTLAAEGLCARCAPATARAGGPLPPGVAEEDAGLLPDAAGRAPVTGRRALAGAAAAPLGGILTPLRGLTFVARHPALWTWIAVPLVLNVALLFGLLWLAMANVDLVLPDLAEPWPAWIDWARTSLGWLLRTLAVLVAVLAAMLATLLLAGIVNAPFYDLLSEGTENRHLGGPAPERPWSQLVPDLLRSIAASLSLALRQLVVLSVLFVFSFTAIGAPLFAAAGFYYAGLALFDVTLARKLYPGAARAAWGRRRWLRLLTAGIGVSLVPPLQPFGIVGATLAYLDDDRK